jgi:uncharacterized repeat protein (TIGR01451 family)
MKILSSLIASVLLSTVAVHAVAAVELKSEAFREVEIKDKDGKVEKKLEPLVRAIPGQQVIYVLTYKNSGKQPASDVIVSNPIPKELTYIAGSETGNGTNFDVSVDSGKVYASLSKLTIKKADGTLRPATAADVTNLRWKVITPLKAGASGSVSYRTVLK